MSESDKGPADALTLGRVLSVLRRRGDMKVHLVLLQEGLEVQLKWPGERDVQILRGEPGALVELLFAQAASRGVQVQVP